MPYWPQVLNRINYLLIAKSSSYGEDIKSRDHGSLGSLLLTSSCVFQTYDESILAMHANQFSCLGVPFCQWLK